MTITACPKGCGGMVNTGVSDACDTCGARLGVQEFGYGDPERCTLRTKDVGGGTDPWGCHKRKGHSTGNGGRHCSTHADCGFHLPSGGICGREPDHDGGIHEREVPVAGVAR